MAKFTHFEPCRRGAGALLVISLCSALVLGACGRSSEPATQAPAAAPPPPAPANLEDREAPAAAPEPREESAPRDGSKPEGNFAQPPKDDLSLAEADLERARTELDGALASNASPSAPRRARPSATAGAAAPSTRGSADEGAPAKADKKSAESSCATACRAFSSLKRAAGAVCRLAGERDDRCSRAHGVVADAEKRVTVCSCPAE